MKKISFMIIISLITVISAKAEIQLSEPNWDLGVIHSQDKMINRDLIVDNTGSSEITVRIIPTCDCLFVAPPEALILPGDSAFFRLTYNPHEDVGPVDRTYIIRADAEGADNIFFPVTGYVDLGGAVPEPENTEMADNTQPDDMDYDINLLYYYMLSCPTCRKFINTGIPGLEQKLGISINLEKRDYAKQENQQEADARLAKLSIEFKEIPLLFIGNTVLQGNTEIDNQLEAEIHSALENNIDTSIDRDIDTENIAIKRNLTILPVFAAGLVDGINPCAFATIIMLISSLALAGRRRREILLIGIFFTASVFVTYYTIGVGIFTAVQAANSFPLMAAILRWALFAALIIFAGLNVYDYFKIKAGKLNEMVLQLSDFFKKKIRDSIHNHIRSAAIVASSLLLGFLVSLFELGCTGQIYLPTIMAMVRVSRELWGFIFLFIYCIGFIIPLVGVFAVAYRGISSQKVAQVFQKNMGLVKLILAGLFLVLAVLTLVVY